MDPRGRYGDLRSWAGRMASALRHRGPDDHGAWADDDVSVGLGHQRLSIMDLSRAGRQPMASPCGRYVIVFNGEIYNHRAIRDELNREFRGEPGRAELCSTHWNGRSDTETLIAAVAHWGIKATLEKCSGMFAIAIWDRTLRILTLARDRMGEKPLYYGFHKGVFLFGSELKALSAHPAFVGELNKDALALYLRHNYVPSPHSIYKDVYKLPPGTFLSVAVNDLSRNALRTPRKYWSARDVAERGMAHQFAGSDSEAADELERVLSEAVAGQMVADVPLGAFLSGGLDSSMVVALMQARADRPVRTFTIGFEEESFNEAEHAAAVANHLGTEHTELYVSPEHALSIIPQLPRIYDEPFSDSSQIPTLLISELTRKHVTVSLSGDGGDEVLGGYNRYFWTRKLWSKFGWIPRSIRTLSSGAITSVPPETFSRGFAKVCKALPSRWRYGQLGDKMHKLAEILPSGSPEEMYLRLVSHWKEPHKIVPGSHEPHTALTDQTQWADLADLESRMMYLDQVTYLPDDILVKVDRAAMAVSLETRVPFLDHRVLEFAWSLPLSMKIRNGQGKWLLRQVLRRYVPDPIMDRPKMGFGVPIAGWLRGPLKDWAEGLLNEAKLREQGVFDPIPIREKWREHIAGTRNWQYYLWDILMFQAWYEEFKPAHSFSPRQSASATF